MKSLLIANRGEIARRIGRTCRAMGIRAVAVFSEPDRDAPFVAEADTAVALGGATAAETYLCIEKLIAAARKSGADAVHPGYGFLSENAEFARACRDAGLTFVGPSPEAIAAMGSKIEAKQRMRAAGVPTLPSVEWEPSNGAHATAEIAKIGWPVLVKASAGGGGRGMRIVRKAGELPSALDAARREAESAFGDGTLFVEPYLESARHVEIQIVGDAHGQVVPLFERECSIQRRHQKIVEESPSPAVDDELRAAMGAAAVRAGEAVGYTGAGTVEFLLRPDGEFFFLEMNTRLQVEHPVTEMVTGLDLVRLQIMAARGERLPTEAIDARIAGHAIEARLYAEDPRRGFLPVNGALHRFRLPPLAGLRVDSGVEDGSVVSAYYDPLLAKVIVHAPTRHEAAHRLAQALRLAEIHGLTTNRELLVRVLEHPEFLSGDTDTHFFARHDPAELGAPLVDADTGRLHAAVAALAGQACRRASASVLSSLPAGWRNNASQKQATRFAAEGGEIDVAYRMDRTGLSLAVDGVELTSCRLGECSAERVDLETNGLRTIHRTHRVGDTWYVNSAAGQSELVELPRFASPEDDVERGSLVAPLPGIVAEIRVAIGAEVSVGDVLLVIESMKMLYPVTAPAAGRVAALRVEPGGHVAAQAVLAVIEEP